MTTELISKTISKVESNALPNEMWDKIRKTIKTVFTKAALLACIGVVMLGYVAVPPAVRTSHRVRQECMQDDDEYSSAQYAGHHRSTGLESENHRSAIHGYRGNSSN